METSIPASRLRDAAATVWLSPPPPPSVLTLLARWPREQFFFQRVAARFILFSPSLSLSLSFFCFCFQKIAFPATHAHKTKSVLHAYVQKARQGSGMGRVWVTGGGLPGHFDRANCLNPRALFAMLCTVFAEVFALLRRRLTLSRSQPSFKPFSRIHRNCCFWSRCVFATIHIPVEWLNNDAGKKGGKVRRERIDDEW